MVRMLKNGATVAVMGLPLWFVVYGLMAQPPAQLKVTLVESDVDVVVDDCIVPVSEGQAGPVQMDPGDHTLRIMRGARLLYSQSVHLRPGGTRVIRASWPLQPAVSRRDSEQGRRFEGHTAPISTLVIAADGRRIMSGSEDRSVRVWDVATGRSILQFDEHLLQVHALAVSPDGRYAVSGGGESASILWEVETGKELQRIAQTGSLWSVAFSQQGLLALYASGSDNIRLFQLSHGKLKEAGVLDAGKDLVSSLAFTPDGACVAAGYVCESDKPNPVRMWDVKSLRPVAMFEGHEDPVWSVAFSPAGDRLASGGTDQTVRVWDSATGRELKRLEGSEGTVFTTAFSPDGRLIVGGTGAAWSNGWVPARGYAVRVWDASTGKQVARFDHEGPVRSVAVSPDGRWVAAAGEDHLVRLWDLSRWTTSPPAERDHSKDPRFQVRSMTEDVFLRP